MNDVDKPPGQETAELLLELGLSDDVVLAALANQVSLTADEAAVALSAARAE